MIIILKPNIDKQGVDYKNIMDYLAHLPGIQVRLHEETGAQQVLTELYLIGNTAPLSKEEINTLSGVERVVRIRTGEENLDAI